MSGAGYETQKAFKLVFPPSAPCLCGQGAHGHQHVFHTMIECLAWQEANDHHSNSTPTVESYVDRGTEWVVMLMKRNPNYKPPGAGAADTPPAADGKAEAEDDE